MQTIDSGKRAEKVKRWETKPTSNVQFTCSICTGSSANYRKRQLQYVTIANKCVSVRANNLVKRRNQV